MGKIIHPRYFPFCYGPEIRGAGLFPDLFPDRWNAITTSLQNAMGLYWRVREYQVTGEVYNPFDPPEGSLQKPFSITYRSTAGSEEDLVCYRGFERSVPEDTFDDARFHIFPSNITPSDLTVFVYGEGDSISVYLDCEITQSEESSNFSTVAMAPPCNPGDPTPEKITAFFQAFGAAIPFSIWSNRPPCSAPPSSGVNLISVSATEYWSYGGTYDTATGLPL